MIRALRAHSFVLALESRQIVRLATAALASTVLLVAITFSAPAAVAAAPMGVAYTPFGPMRFVDSRSGQGISSRLAAYKPATFAVAGVNGLPTNATAVTANLTVISPTANGWVALTTDPDATPGTSTVNIPVGDVRANGVFARLSTAGDLSVTASTSVDIVLDVTGYFMSTGDTWSPIGPVRDLDTRLPGSGGVFHSNSPRTLLVAGVNGVPAAAMAVTGNVTVTGQTCGGYIAVTKTPTAKPKTSTLNFPAGDTRSNNFTSPLAPNGSLGLVMVGRSDATANVIVDITGYFMNDASGALYYPITPERAADSRLNNGLNGPIPTHGTVTLGIVGRLSDIPAKARAITGNLTVTAPVGSGYIAITPYSIPQPRTSTLNFPAKDTRANGFVSALGAGSLGLTYIDPGTGQIVVDVTGYFAGGTFADPAPPAFTGMSLYRYSAWSHQATQTLCAGASTQMIINLVTGASNHRSANQLIYYNYGRANSSRRLAVGVPADGWANATTHYGAGFYTFGVYSTFDKMIKVAATQMRITGKPVGLTVMEGSHAWVMAGFTSTGADPATSQSFTVTSVTVMAPDYGTIGYDPAPGSIESIAYMKIKMDGKMATSNDTYLIIYPW